MDSMRRQIQENKDFRQNVKSLESKTVELKESETLKKAKELLSKAKTEMSQNAAAKQVQQALEEIKKHANQAGKSVDDIIQDLNETEFIRNSKLKIMKMNKAIEQTTEPIRKHPAYKEVKKEVQSLYDESNSRYSGYKSKQEREKIKQRFDKKPLKPVKPNLEAGENVVLHKDAKQNNSDSELHNPIFKTYSRLKNVLKESENPFISYGRELTEKAAKIFEESEHAKAIKYFREKIDPSFDPDEFLTKMRTYIIPEILDGYHELNKIKLRQWCSEGVVNILLSEYGQITKNPNIETQSQVFDLRKVEIVSIKILENDVPVIIFSFETQELLCIIDKSTKKQLFGSNSKVKKFNYVVVVTHKEELVDDPDTNGWQIIELARR